MQNKKPCPFGREQYMAHHKHKQIPLKILFFNNIEHYLECYLENDLSYSKIFGQDRLQLNFYIFA